ncbi:MAG TPA: alpha/beta hydrolase [Polyangiaceae bacterium]|nr:alpha/beta hydrolase [Polyangiaceae bacterium]
MPAAGLNGSSVGSSFKASDGVEIRYTVFGAPRGIPVVLHHGFAADTKTNWLVTGLVSALTDAGHCVVCLDARGHGQSEKPHDPALYGEHAMARDLRELFDRLRAPSYDMVGYSMGAIVALLVATTDTRVRRLVLGGIGAGAVELGGVDTRALSPAAVVKALETENPATIADPLALQFRAFADAIEADRAALAAHAQAVHARPIAFAQIAAPTLLLAGDDEPLATRPEVLANAIAGAELRRLRGDHMSALFDPEFKKALVTFLA